MVFEKNYWKRQSYPNPFGDELTSSDAAAVIAGFWSNSDFSKGGDVYYGVSRVYRPVRKKYAFSLTDHTHTKK